MKRGLAVVLFSLLLMPLVAAQTSVLDIFFGTSEESVLLLKAMYTALVFIIFYKVSKESVFKETRDARFATVFSLILSLLTMRFTPDSVVTAFGWVITLIAPFAIFYKLTGMFIKPKPGEAERFSWLRFILALIATLLVLVALGNYSGFSTNIGGTPLVGAGLDELFSDIHYFVFYKLDWFFALFLVGIAVYLLYYFASRISGRGTGGAEGDVQGIGFGKGLLIVLGIGLLVALLGYLLSGGLGIFGALGSSLAGIGGILLYGLGALALLALIIGLFYLFYRYRGYTLGAGKTVGGGIGWFVKVVLPIVLGGFWAFLKGLWWFIWNFFKGLGWLGKRSWKGAKRIPGAVRGKNLYVTLRVPQKTIHLFDRDRTFIVAPESTTPILVTVSQGRTQFTSRVLQGVQCTFSVDNGIVTPNNAVSTKKGHADVIYEAPAEERVARLEIAVTHPDISPTVIDPYTITIRKIPKEEEKPKTEPEKETPKGKLSVIITNPKEGDVFTPEKLMNVTFTVKGGTPLSYGVLFSSEGPGQFRYLEVGGKNFVIGPEARGFMFTVPEEDSDNCYIRIQANGARGPIGFFTSGRFAIRRSGESETLVPPEESERPTTPGTRTLTEVEWEEEEKTEQPTDAEVSPSIVLLAPSGNTIEEGELVNIAWNIRNVSASFSADMIIGYSIQGPRGPYSGIARVTTKQKGLCKWNVPLMPKGTVVYLRLYVPDISADRVFGPFNVSIDDAGRARAGPTLVPEEQKTGLIQLPEEDEVTSKTGLIQLSEEDEVTSKTGLIQLSKEDEVTSKIKVPEEEEITEQVQALKELPEILLVAPTNNEYITKKTYEIKWRFLHVPKYFTTDLTIAAVVDGETHVIREKKSGTVGTVIWNVPEVTHDQGVYLEFVVPGLASQRFGPFKLKGTETEDLETGLEVLEASLGQIKLPFKRSRLSKKVDVGTFLYYLVSTNEMNNYITSADRLKDIAQQIENPVVQKKLGNLYGQYLGKLHEIEETRQRLQGLEKRSEVRARLLQLFADKSNGFIRIINKSLLEDFKKHYGVDIRRLTAAQIANNVNYMAWVMERAQMIDELMGVSGSNMGLRSLYRFVEYTMDQTEVLSKQLQDARELARKMRKQLKSR